MPSRITRRDFMNGAALTIAAGLTPLDQLRAQGAASAYPPALTGLRGLTDESFAIAHKLAIEKVAFDIDKLAVEETFDLVVVGAGLAGLTAAWSYRERNPKAKILILDAMDDFGGHATRNEFTAGGRLIIGYGGSESMVAADFGDDLQPLLKRLKIDPKRFEKESVFHRTLYPGMNLKRAVFFDSETFGRDTLVTGDPIVQGYNEFAPKNPGARKFADFVADCPLSGAAKTGLIELEAGTRDYMAGLSLDEKIAKLEKVSYRQFLIDIAKLPKDGADFFQNRTADNWGYAIDALSAVDCMKDGLPGAKAVKVDSKVKPEEGEAAPYVHHFPDGNASLARALVRSLIKGIAPGSTMDDLVTAKFDYGRLDIAGEPVRIRLRSTAVRVRNSADGKTVEIGYVTGGRLHRVAAKHAVMSTYMNIMPHVCPELNAEGAGLMAQNVKAPLVYTKVIVKSWECFVKLGVHRIAAPTAFHNTVKLDYPVSLGSYRFPRDPKQPICVHMVHVPTEPGKGLDARGQARAGRQRLLGTPYADIEKAVRSDLDRMLGPGGFQSGRDILAITVNRWSHGYAYTPSTLYDDPEALKPRQEALRSKIGRIAFASSDTAWDAYAHSAMSEAVRAVDELTPKPAAKPKGKAGVDPKKG